MLASVKSPHDYPSWVLSNKIKKRGNFEVDLVSKQHQKDEILILGMSHCFEWRESTYATYL